MNVISLVSTGYHLIKLSINSDANIKSLIYVGDKIVNSKTSQRSVHKLFQNQELQTLYDTKSGLAQIFLKDLKSMGPSTFGNKVYHFYKNNKLDMYPMKGVVKWDKPTYISERTRKCHDFLHVLLGFDTDLIGEAQVNAFVANQCRTPMSFLILSGILIKFFFTKPEKFSLLVDGIVEGWKQGNQYENFLLQDWDEMLKWSLQDIENHLLKSDQSFAKIRTIMIKL